MAGFTGAPPMNLVDCTLRDGVADLGGAQIRVPADLARKAATATQLKLGVRPENITLAPQGDGDLTVQAEVALLEPLGAETLATLRIGTAEMIARLPATFRATPGTPLQVHMPPARLHLFDAGSGQALR